MSFRMAHFNADNSSWIQSWTIFYWAWWISWSLFVGTFIARVSIGRTIKEYVFGVLAVPTVFSMIWFAIFRGTGIYFEMFKDAGICEAMNQGEYTEIALFTTLRELPWE